MPRIARGQPTKAIRLRSSERPVPFRRCARPDRWVGRSESVQVGPSRFVRPSDRDRDRSGPDRTSAGRRWAKSCDGKFVSTFRAFCQKPTLASRCASHGRDTSGFRRNGSGLVFEQENLDAVIADLGTQDRCVLVMDATFKTNVQDLVLASLGLVLHQVGGVVLNRFWPEFVLCVTRR